MAQDRDLLAVADACVGADVAIKEHGTLEMKAAMQVLLMLVGLELAKEVGLSSVSDIDGQSS